ncbi:hypothetical protein STENM327S_00224 [Streptomyces tendae]
MKVHRFRCGDGVPAVSLLLSVRGGREAADGGFGPHRWLELRRFRSLYESGAMSLREIAKETGLNRRTVSKYLKDPASIAPPKRYAAGQRPRRVVDEVAPLIDAMLRSEILLKGKVIHERLVQDYGVTINYQRVKLYLQEARPRIADELGISPGELAGLHRRFEVVPELRPKWIGATRARSSLMSASRRSILPHDALVLARPVLLFHHQPGPCDVLRLPPSRVRALRRSADEHRLRPHQDGRAPARRPGRGRPAASGGGRLRRALRLRHRRAGRLPASGQGPGSSGRSASSATTSSPGGPLPRSRS